MSDYPDETTVSELIIQLNNANVREFSRPAVAPVWDHYRGFMATGAYPYISDVFRYIVEREPELAGLVDVHQAHAAERNGARQHLARSLEHEIYLASGQWHLDELVAEERRYLADGWRPITDLEPREDMRISLSPIGSYRLVPARRWDKDTDWVLLPPRARTNGVSLQRLQDEHRAFLKAKDAGNRAGGVIPKVRMYRESGRSRGARADADPSEEV